jgi:hypothetical protein
VHEFSTDSSAFILAGVEEYQKNGILNHTAVKTSGTPIQVSVDM